MPGKWGRDNGNKIRLTGCHGLWVLKLVHLFIYLLIFKSLGTSASNTAENNYP